MAGPPTVVDLLALYDELGRERYDEKVTQLDHALQTAALAEAAGASDALVAAALLHDVGHLLEIRAGWHPGEGGDARHEAVGARFLVPLFGPEVTAPIALHVAAKRYRCAVDPEYHDVLSPGSKASLERQGGLMGREEVDAFAARPGAVAALRLREWDDLGKVDGPMVAPLEGYRDLLERVARNSRSAAAGG